MMLIARTRHELNAVRETLAKQQATLTLVPTMGALHAGHTALISHARRNGACVIASIFVNPAQFGPADDLARYPRDEDGDLATLRQAGCDAVWLPTVETMYPAGDVTFIDMGGPALGWEGAARPGHFRGVATVVAKLFGQIRPQSACFGEKDWQQLQVIRRMVRDLAIPVQIEPVPTLRETDGLAMSSRNRFLDSRERASAPILYATLVQMAATLRAGGDAGAALHDARRVLESGGMSVDYLALIDGDSLLPIETLQPGARLIAACRLGSVRLLDNIDPLRAAV